MKKIYSILVGAWLTVSALMSQDLVIPPKIQDEINIKLKKFEGNIDFNQNIADILKYDHHFVEEIIFQKIKEIESKNPIILTQFITILGDFDSPRVLITLNKFSEPFLEITDKDKPISRPRHIRISAIKALLQKTNEERINIVIKYITDIDPLFQCALLKLLKEKEIKEAIEPSYEIFKKTYTDENMSVKTDAASLIISISKDPQIKNSVLLNMLIDPNIHIRKASLTLFSDGGLPGDAQVRRKLLENLKTAKEQELELSCKVAGILKLVEAKDELLIILNREKSPFIKWECLNTLHKINYDNNEINNRIKKIIDSYKVNENIQNADQERFKKLLESINSGKDLQ